MLSCSAECCVVHYVLMRWKDNMPVGLWKVVLCRVLNIDGDDSIAVELSVVVRKYKNIIDFRSEVIFYHFP